MSESWHDQSAFWDELRSVIFSQRRRDAAPAEIDALIALAGLTPGASVLDMPCGVGRHSIELAKRGFRVTGVDRYGPYVAESSRSARDAEVEIEFLTGDMREFIREGAFDVGLNLFTSLGYFKDLDDERRVLRNYRTSLKPGSVLVLEMMSKEILARIFEPRSWTELADGTVVREERIIEDAWRFVRTKWTVIQGGKRFEHETRLRNFAASDLIDLLDEAGFVGVQVYGSLEGIPYDHEAQRLVVVARRG